MDNIPDCFELSEREYHLCIVDADIVAYRAACAAEKTEYELYDNQGCHVERFKSAKACKEHLEELSEFLMEDISGYERRSVVVDGGLDTAQKALISLVTQIKKEVDAKDYRFYLTGTDNFRNDIATLKKYKGNRTGPKPKYLEDTRNYLIAEHGAKVINGVESDDACSVALFNGFSRYGVDCNVCLVSIDKDLLGTPGVHYNFIKKEWIFIDEFTADYHLFKQALTGDRTDNISGLSDLTKEFREKYNLSKRKGVGDKTAESLLSECMDRYEMYETVLTAYFDWYGHICVYKDWTGVNRFGTFEDIADENIELVFMERVKGVRWKDYKRNYVKENDHGN
jgi:5'-3' exonuclease